LREISLPGERGGEMPLGTPDRRVACQLDEWFAGRRHAFDLVLDLEGVDGFRRTVLETLVDEVPWGETVSYGELAALSGRPRAARAVGSAMRHNPVPFVIPCHRVIAAGNKIGGYGGGCPDARSRCAALIVPLRLPETPLADKMSAACERSTRGERHDHGDDLP